MSLDLFTSEINDSLSRMNGAKVIEPGVFDGFLRGSGESAMQTFAKAGRAASLAAIAPVIATERFTDGTVLQDRLFKLHDDVFGRAVDHWTPNPNEVGVAGQVVGQLLAMLPMVIASPAATVAATGLGTMEDLARKGVPAGKAIAVGEAQAVGLGLGVWMPILGNNGWQRVALGGAGFNVLQGVATRGASGAILEGLPVAEEFKAFDPTALTLDVLLGLAFGSMAHLSPRARAQGAEVWTRLEGWAKNLEPSQIEALAVLRQAQQLNVDSLAGRPAQLQDIEAHTDRVRTALDQLGRGEVVNVEDLPAPRVESDGRVAEMAERARELVAQADQVRKVEGLPELKETEGPPAPTIRAEPPPPRGEGGEAPARPEATIEVNEQGNFITARVGSAGYVGARLGDGVLKVATADIPDPSNRGQGLGKQMYLALVEYAASNGLRLISDETVEAPAVRVYESLEKDGYTVKRNPNAKPLAGDAPGLFAPKGESVFEVSGPLKPKDSGHAEKVDPLSSEADEVVAQMPLVKMRVGEAVDGTPIELSAKDYLAGARERVKQAREDASLFEVAAACMLGVS